MSPAPISDFSPFSPMPFADFAVFAPLFGDGTTPLPVVLAASEQQVSGEWVIALVTAVIGAILGALGRGAIQTRQISPSPFPVVNGRVPAWHDFEQVGT
jgi:hypothetical protein